MSCELRGFQKFQQEAEILNILGITSSEASSGEIPVAKFIHSLSGWTTWTTFQTFLRAYHAYIQRNLSKRRRFDLTDERPIADEPPTYLPIALDV